jgi:two-component system chemotaxis response regulator CheB
MRGAVDFVPKPAASTDIRHVIEELSVKIRIAAGTKRLPAATMPKPHLTPEPAVPSATKTGLRPFHPGDPVVVIGASTGGPRALQQVLADLPADLPAAVAIVQHMPAGFTRSLAQRLNENSPLTVQEATEGDRLAQGLALLAPGNFHLRFKGNKQVALDQGERRQHVRPAVDVAMESASEQHHQAVLGVILTGMGADGTAGARCIKTAGGQVIAEHESTSLVYGMPRSVIEAGLTDRVVPLTEVASTIVEVLHSGRYRV